MRKQMTVAEFEAMDHGELARLAHTLQDTAHLFDLIYADPTYVSFYTGMDGQGGVLKERYFSRRPHHDAILEREAIKKGRRLGACSFVMFKAIGVPVNIYYGRYGEDSRLDFLEAVQE